MTSDAGSEAEEVMSDIGSESLPSGWKKKESKSHPGKFYYISPSGQTQWVRPVVASILQEYNWVFEITVEFGPGRLGVGLREVDQQTHVPYQEFQAEVEDLPKLPNGKAGPAEIYNWSVKADKRLSPGMRVTAIDSDTLAGCTYTDVIERLRKAPRPVKITFADVSIGTIEEQDERAKSNTVQPDEAIASHEPEQSGPSHIGSGASAYSDHKQLSTEYRALLVLSELHKEAWLSQNQKLVDSKQQMRVKLAVVTKEFNQLKEHHDSLRREHKKLSKMKQQLEHERHQLKLQAQGRAESKEMERTRILQQKNTELGCDIEGLSSGNKKLKAQRENLQRALNDTEEAISRHSDGSAYELTPERLEAVGIVSNIDHILSGSLPHQISIIKDKLKKTTQDLEKEEAKVRSVTKEIDMLGGQMKGSPPRSPSRKPSPRRVQPQSAVSGLENKIDQLRRELHETVTAMAKAAKAGDTDLANSNASRRLQLKKELNTAQDQLRILQENPAPVSHSQSLRSLPTMSGILDKSPNVTNEGGLLNNVKSMRGARERWCDLSPNGVLSWYKRKGDSEPRGQIDLREDSLEVVCDDQQRGMEFLLTTSELQIRFVGRNRADVNNWVHALRTSQTILRRNRGLDHQKSKRRIADGNEAVGQGRATLGFN